MLFKSMTHDTRHSQRGRKRERERERKTQDIQMIDVTKKTVKGRYAGVVEPGSG